MEFLRNGSIDEAEPTTEETSKDIAIVDSGGEKGSSPADSAVELDKPEAWSEHHQGEPRQEQLAIGSKSLVGLGYQREVIQFPIYFREEGVALCCASSWSDLLSRCSQFLL